jgi:LDH2 family malate/lactate/ureidoglycolate dehydrogenase
MSQTITQTVAVLQQLGKDLLVAAGTPLDLATAVAESLVEANVSGHDSHGMQNLPGYLNAARAGRVQPAIRAAVTSRQAAIATVDGGWGWGQPAARLATETAIALADEFGVSAVVIRRCNHIGRAGQYVEIMSRAGMTGIVLANAGPAVAPYSGTERRLGTNPFAWAAPTADPQRPLLLDFATSTVAIGKLALAQASGQQAVAPGLLLDIEGHPSTTPDDFFTGGSLLPFGGHKGFAMGVMLEVLGGALSGGSPSCLPGYNGGNGTLLVAFNIASFQPLDSFVEQVEQFSAALKSTRPAEGFDEVLLPGEPEARARRQRREHGVSLPASTWAELRDQAAQFGVTIGQDTAADPA